MTQDEALRKEREKEFDEHFYEIGWMGAGGSGMGRGLLKSEIKSFIAKEIATAHQRGREEGLKRLAERVEYWETHGLSSGWTGAESGECCVKCRMESPTNPLQSVVGCRNPFQIPETCQCHIRTRQAVKNRVLLELNALKAHTPKNNE